MSTTTPFVRTPWRGHADQSELDRWLPVAETVRERLAAGALERDRASARPAAELDVLREAGLDGLLVPIEFGGHGAHWETAFAITRILARADASVAQILGYHYLNQACITFYCPSGEQQADWYRRTSEGRWFWSDSFNPVSPDLSVVAEGENYRLNGLKRFATGASVADKIITGGIAQGGWHDGQLLIFAVDGQREGVEHLDDWDHLGQRASASGSVRYSNVLITPDDVIGVDLEEPFSTVVTPGVQLLFGNVYLGIAEGALAQARELTLARKNSWFLSTVDRYSDDPFVHRVFGELVSRTAAVEALADKLGRRFDTAAALGADTTAADRAELEIAIAQLKVVSTEVGLDVASRVFEVTGASSTSSANGLDIYWRNLRTHSLHDPVDYKKSEVGANYLTGAVAPISLYT
ncbi:acyl-CoA dehydrogenase family protein [Salinibacterium sp. ZJ450]|uniref:acyl-CoA dehydrogenase family protein n=1 Tax=Salinibacterium sp. ZJ450 TaxID=2708338 RepID=UPI0014227860|nr:acyl-CoA dehydrogenase family protein [Salinibacterium sp. ZJ450]